jgi:hypothetical protein
MGLFDKSYSTQQAELTPEQKQMIAGQKDLFLNTFKPIFEDISRGAVDLYKINQPGSLNAAQNLAGTAGQVQRTAGETGESALRTGVAGLQSLFSPQYERSQIMSAMAPAQSQYQTNVANLRNQFGGMGQLGSARQALAERQLAAATQGAQAQTAAQIQRDIAAQRLQAATGLAGIGQGNLGQALGAAGQQVYASQLPMLNVNQFLQTLYGAPAQAYNPNFAGTQGQTSTKTGISLFG